MIYILFSVSLIVYLLLKIGQAYYHYFSIIPPLRNFRDKKRKKSNFPRVPQILIWIFFTSRKPNWTIKGDKSVERILSIIKSLSHFIFIFCIVAFIFSFLQFLLDTSTQIESVSATILKIEETQIKIREFVSHFKIGFGYDVLIVFLLITFASSFPLLEKYKAKDKLKRFNKAIKTILYFLTISTSFTFFGNKFATGEEGRIGELEIHKLQIFKGNKLLLKKINDVVTEKVINEIISNPEFEKVLDHIEDVKKIVEETKQDDDYKNFVSVAPANYISNLPIAGFESGYSGKYNFNRDFEKAENKFQNEYKKYSSAQSDFYEAREKSDFTNFRERNQSWYQENEFTENTAKQAEETFTKASEASSAGYAKYYSRYRDPIEKLIKKGYSNTGGKWIKSFFETLGVDFPFLDELIDPIINEPIQNYITKKTESIFMKCIGKKINEVVTELTNCSADFKKAFVSKVSSSKKFSRLKEQVMTDLNTSRQISSLTKSHILLQIKNAEAHLNRMCEGSRWEGIRQKFSEQLNSGAKGLEKFSFMQKRNFREVLNDWNYYKESQKLNWYFASTNNLEEQFFNYSRYNGNIKATWGFIIQQQDWDNALNYLCTYRILHPKENIQTNPRYMLKYYWSSLDMLLEFDKLYDDETNINVGFMCPD